MASKQNTNSHEVLFIGPTSLLSTITGRYTLPQGLGGYCNGACVSLEVSELLHDVCEA